MSYDMENFKSDCYEFNTLAGKGQLIDKNSVNAQIDLIVEELKETRAEFYRGSVMGLTDGVMDVLVTTFGLMQKLQAMGVDVWGAAKAVAENNLSKFITDPDVVTATLDYYERNKPEEEVRIEIVKQERGRPVMWVAKNKVGKVMKPSNFRAVRLEGFVGKATMQG